MMMAEEAEEAWYLKERRNREANGDLVEKMCVGRSEAGQRLWGGGGEAKQWQHQHESISGNVMASMKINNGVKHQRKSAKNSGEKHRNGSNQPSTGERKLNGGMKEMA